MKNKKKLWWLALPIGIAVLWFGFYTFLNIIDPPLYDEYPRDSKKNEFMLYNDGCCFFLKDFSIWFLDQNEEEYPLFENSAPPYGKRLIADFPQDISGPFRALVSFQYEYDTAGYTEFSIMDFESLEALKKDGLLLIFGDGTLQVKSGKSEKLFSYDKEPWAVEYPLLTPEQSTVSSTPPQTSKTECRIEDAAIRKTVESYFEKSESEFTDEDYKKLSELEILIIDEPVESLNDIPTLFPSLKYLCVDFYEPILQADCDILTGMNNLKAVKIYSPVLPSLSFIKKLSYVDIQYNEASYISNNNLASASVLGEDFINEELTGQIKNYVRIIKEDTIYELFSTDYELPSDNEFREPCYEAKVFVSKTDGETSTFQSEIIIENRIGNAMSGLHIIDVDFDGNDDILIKEGHFGNQGAVTYSCFLNRNGSYEYCSSFSEIPNVSVDEKNSKILSSWRNWAASHSWAMYEFVDGQFVMTDCLTEEPEEDSTEDNEIWTYTVEGKSDNGRYSTKDYSDEQIFEMFFDESSYWGLISDKWNTINNSGKMVGFSIYGDDSINPTIERIIQQ